MQMFTLDNRPDDVVAHRKKTTVNLSWQTEPFQVDQQERVVTISPEEVDNWEGGYYVAYPDDGSKPYPISKSFVDENYVPVDASE